MEHTETLMLKMFSKVLISTIMLLVFTCQSAIGIRPSHAYSRTPSDIGLAFDSLNISTENNARLTGWICKPIEDKNPVLIILASSDAGNMSDNLDIAQALVSNFGVKVLLFDYRGFGTSDALPMDTDLIALPAFANDLFSVITWAKNNIQSDSNKIIIYGRSMGASLALTVTSRYGGVGGVVAESPYVSQNELHANIVKKYKALNVKRDNKYLSSELLEPLPLISKYSKKLLLIHGEEEDLISSKEIFDLYNACLSQSKSLWIVSKAKHLEVPFKETSLFLNAFLSFIASVKE